MGQVSTKLRRTDRGYAHWCPGCRELHHIITEPGGGVCWTFDGQLETPTFGPSVKITYGGADAGQEDPDFGRMPPACCHYFLKAGRLEFCGDSTHALAGQTVDLPDLPSDHRD